jgi:hypothetical protein
MAKTKEKPKNMDAMKFWDLLQQIRKHPKKRGKEKSTMVAKKNELYEMFRSQPLGEHSTKDYTYLVYKRKNSPKKRALRFRPKVESKKA